MGKIDILEKFWIEYLRHWKNEIRDLAKPPSEDDFWAWYTFRKLDQEHNPNLDPEVNKDEDKKEGEVEKGIEALEEDDK